MQTIVFPEGILLVRDFAGHDGLFIWSSSSIWANTPPLTARAVPTSMAPYQIRAVPCPNCDHPQYFPFLHSQHPHQCEACLHIYGVLAVPNTRWEMVKRYLPNTNPWLRKSYRQVRPAYIGAPEIEEYDDENAPSPPPHLLYITTGSNTVTNADISGGDPRGMLSGPPGP